MPKLKKAKRPWYTRLTKRTLLLIGVALVLLIGGGFAYAQFRDEQPSDQPVVDDTSEQNDDYINLNPPTEEEKQETEANKKALAEDRPSPPPTSNGKKQVTPVITSATASEVNAYVPGIFEDGGTCTATATRGSQIETTSSSGFENYNTTSCAPLKFSPALSGSGWSVVVSYSSSTAQGKSEAEPVN